MRKLSKELGQKLKSVKLIVFDVDGVLTDGRVYLSEVGEIKVFNTKDSFRTEIALKSGLKIVWFTGRKTPMVVARAKQFEVEVLFKQDTGGSLLAYIKEKYNIDAENIVYVGDDWSDLYLMRQAGLSAAPNNATPENREVADIVTETDGGQGVAGEIVEMVMRAQGTWEKYSKEYINKFVF